MESLSIVIGLLVFMVIGLLVYIVKDSLLKWLGRTGEKGVYMIINLQMLDPEKHKVYQKAAIPLAEKAGLKFLAAAEPEVLAGNWPFQGAVVIEKFQSMSAVKQYWFSDEYQEAKKLLDGADIRDFTILIEE